LGIQWYAGRRHAMRSSKYTPVSHLKKFKVTVSAGMIMTTVLGTVNEL